MDFAPISQILPTDPVFDTNAPGKYQWDALDVGHMIVFSKLTSKSIRNTSIGNRIKWIHFHLQKV